VAPPRALQPGEACQVLAPISREVVVDRAKLLALGVPQGCLTETAWMLLCWRAAAAGWRSYSMGKAGTVSQQPELAVAETAFLLRLLASPSLRRLGPQTPAPRI
jgi:hypothetical protein